MWQAIASAGLPSAMLGLNYPPHLSLMLCEDIDMDGVRQVLPGFIARQPPIALDFPALGFFPGEEGVIYLAPTVNRELLDFHERLWELLEPFTTRPIPLYRPGAWVPHVTLDLEVNLEQAGAAIAALNRLDHMPLHGTASTLFVADFAGERGGARELFVSGLGSC
jgi:2'-5' RNA ligase